MKSRFNEMRLNQIEEDFRHDWRKHRTDIIQTIKDALREKNRWYFKNKLPLAEIKETNLPPDNSEELEALKKKVEDIIYKSLPRSSDDIKNHLIQYLNQGGIYGTPSNATTTSFTFWSKGILFPSCEILQIYVDENLDGSVRVTQRYIFKKPIALSKGKMPSIPLAVIETISEIKDVINTYKLNGTVIRSYKDGVQRHASSVPGMEVSHLYQTDNVYLLEGYTLELRSNLERDDENNETSNKIYISPKNKTYDILDLEGNWQKGSLNNIDLSNLTNRLNDETLIMQILEITSTAGHTIFDLTNDEKRKSYIHKRYGMSVENVCKELAEKRKTEFEKSDRQKKLDSFFNNDEPNNHPDDSSISEIETVSPEIEKVEKKDEAMESSGESKEMSETSNSGEKMKDKTSEDISSSPDERIENDLAEEPLKLEEKIRHSDGENDSFYESNSSTSEEESESSMEENSEEKKNKEYDIQIMKNRFTAINEACHRGFEASSDDDIAIQKQVVEILPNRIDASILDNLLDTKQEILDHILAHPEVLTISSVVTRDCLPDSFEIESLQPECIEYHINTIPVLRFRERFLVKSNDKPFAFIETEFIFFWNAKENKVSQEFNRDLVHIFEKAGEDYFVKPFEKFIYVPFKKTFAIENSDYKEVTFAKSIPEVEEKLAKDIKTTNESKNELLKNLSRNNNPVAIEDIKAERIKQLRLFKTKKMHLDFIKDDTQLTDEAIDILNTPDQEFNEQEFNYLELFRLELAIERLFRRFNENIAKDALKKADYLKRSTTHGKSLELDNAIRYLLAIIKANQSDELNKDNIAERYGEKTYNELLTKYSNENEQDLDNSDDVTITPEIRNLVLKQQAIIIENSDSLIPLPEFDNIQSNLEDEENKQPGVLSRIWFATKNWIKKHPYATAFIIVSLVLITAAVIAAILHTAGAATIPIFFAAKALGGAVLGSTATATASFWTGAGIIMGITAAVYAAVDAVSTFVFGLILDKTLNAPKPPIPGIPQQQPQVVNKNPSGKSASAQKDILWVKDFKDVPISQANLHSEENKKEEINPEDPTIRKDSQSPRK